MPLQLSIIKFCRLDAMLFMHAYLVLGLALLVLRKESSRMDGHYLKPRKVLHDEIIPHRRPALASS
jgi:hypothetical protein